MKSIALFSIKPEYVKTILTSSKRYEFRRILCRRPVEKIVIYETSPVCRIVGEVSMDCILVKSPKELWNITKNFSGMDEQSFLNYFKGKNVGIAYSLINPKKYDKSVSLHSIDISVAPQSFVYLTEKQYFKLKSLNS